MQPLSIINGFLQLPTACARKLTNSWADGFFIFVFWSMIVYILCLCAFDFAAVSVMYYSRIVSKLPLACTAYPSTVAWREMAPAQPTQSERTRLHSSASLCIPSILVRVHTTTLVNIASMQTTVIVSRSLFSSTPRFSLGPDLNSLTGGQPAHCVQQNRSADMHRIECERSGQHIWKWNCDHCWMGP